MPQTKKILWIASVFFWLLPRLWQNPFFLLALGPLFNDTLKDVLKFRWHLKALLTLIGLKHLFMVNCVLSGLFLKEKKRWIDLGMCLKLSRCLSALQSWGLRTESNPLWSQRMDFPCSVPGVVEQFVWVAKWSHERHLKEYFFSIASNHGCQLLTTELWNEFTTRLNGPTQNLF